MVRNIYKLVFSLVTGYRVAESGLDVFAHNIETVERLTPGVRDPRARYTVMLPHCTMGNLEAPFVITNASKGLLITSG